LNHVLALVMLTDVTELTYQQTLDTISIAIAAPDVLDLSSKKSQLRRFSELNGGTVRS
jgi:hypothetical protein